MTGVHYSRKSNRCRCGGGQAMGLLSAASMTFPEAVYDKVNDQLRTDRFMGPKF
jgi:hypothetical protein